MKASQKIKILIADNETQTARQTAKYLTSHGFNTQVATGGKDAKDKLLKFQPRFVLANLMLPEFNAFELIKFIKTEKNLHHKYTNVIVMSGHNSVENVKQAIREGARDYIVRPIRPQDLLARLLIHCRQSRFVKEISANDHGHVDEASLMLHLTDLVLRTAVSGSNLSDTLFNLTRMVNLRLQGVRCSVINVLDQHLGYVVTSSDNICAAGIKLNLIKYPEVLTVANTGHLMAIENIENDINMAKFKPYFQEVDFNSMVVCPLEKNGEIFGVLSLRMPPEKSHVSDNEIRFVEIVSHVISLTLSSQLSNKTKEFWLSAA